MNGMNNGEMIIYQTEDGLAQINLTAIEGTVWLTQEEIADLFDKGRSTVTEHIQNIISDEELNENSVCRNFRRTAKDGKDYSVLHYNLEHFHFNLHHSLLSRNSSYILAA